MRMLYSGNSAPALEALDSHPPLRNYFGWLNTPRTARAFPFLVGTGLPIFCDNSAYRGLNEDKFYSFLARASNYPVQWICVPDVLGDAKATIDRYWEWRDRICSIPRALVGQDGAEELDLPWADFACLFIGGSESWKLSRCAAALIAEAKQREKWVHMGAVNSYKRMGLAHRLGCDSVDGTGVSLFSRKYLLPFLLELQRLDQQYRLEL